MKHIARSSVFRRTAALLLGLAGAAALALQLLVLFVPFLRDIFRLAVLTPIQWAVVILLALVPLAVVEAMKALGLTGEHWQKTA